MARPIKDRRIEFVPEVTMFKPCKVVQCKTNTKLVDEIILTLDEVEAIRLKDLEDLEQEDCALRMEISRPTFQRILSIARKKIAEALVEGKVIKFEGGNYQIAMRHFECQECVYAFEMPYGNGIKGRDMNCPKCKKKAIHRINENKEKKENKE